MPTVGMDYVALEKLNKVLALADSSHEGEAMAALRATRTLLKYRGISLSDLLQEAMQMRGTAIQRPSMDVVVSLQREIIQLQQKVSQLQMELREQQSEARHWRQKAEANKNTTK